MITHMTIKIKCYGCIWLREFDSTRPDEPSNFGCKKPGYEGYTDPNNPDCGGVFYSEKPINSHRDF